MITEAQEAVINTAFSDTATSIVDLVIDNVAVILPIAVVILGIFLLLRIVKRVAK